MKRRLYSALFALVPEIGVFIFILVCTLAVLAREGVSPYLLALIPILIVNILSLRAWARRKP